MKLCHRPRELSVSPGAGVCRGDAERWGAEQALARQRERVDDVWSAAPREPVRGRGRAACHAADARAQNRLRRMALPGPKRLSLAKRCVMHGAC